MMKKIVLSLVAIFAFATAGLAQSASTGDLFNGMTKSVPEGRTIIPYGLEVTFDKTVHLIFPAPIRYVDLGSNNLVAGKAEDAENVLRIKASVRDFEVETNLSVICNDGSFFAFNVRYSDEPEKLNLEMKDFLYGGPSNVPTNRADIYFRELGSESPVLVKLIMQTIHSNNKRLIRHIGAKQFGVQFTLKGLYTHNGLIYFHTAIKNSNNLAYHIDHVSFRVVDKDTTKRMATQELDLKPLRAYNDLTQVKGRKEERTIYCLEAFTLPHGKQLEITLHEYNGGRTLTYYVENDDIVRAENIDDLQLKF